MARAATAKAKRAPGKAKRRPKPKPDPRPWWLWTLAVLAAFLAVRLAVNAAELVPVHFDEAQYWAYGQELAWGYFSKPPLVGAAIRLTTDLFGDTLFALRIASPVAHALVAWLIFATARRLFDGRTGFWAAVGYTAAPGVGVSSMIVSTDPIMMVFWGLALYGTVRAREGGAPWWALVGAAIGAGMLAKYTMVAFAVGLIGWMMLSAERRDWRGLGIAALAALVVFSPNLLWNLQNGFATIVHVAEDAAPAGSRFNPDKLAEFLGAQLGVIGPLFFGAILLACWRRLRGGAPGVDLLLWQTIPLLAAMLAIAFFSRAQPNWAAPAYVAGSILAAHLLLGLDRRRLLLWGQGALGVGACALVWVLALIYTQAEEWPRAPDPFKKMRIAEPFCGRALSAMGEEGTEVLLSTDRRRLSECMFLGGLGWDEVAVWNPDQLPANHHELVATLYAGDDRPMLLAVFGGGAEIARQFEDAREIETGRFRTHADRDYGISLWAVQGFRGY